MKKNRIALAIILIILVMTLVACGDTVDAPDKDEYVVTIHPNNGEEAFEWKVTDPIPNLTYEGYVLEGFYVDSDFTSSISLSTLKITGLNGNIDVYIKWKKEECEHDVVIDDAVPATCTEKGLTEGKHCSKCDEVILAQTEVPALGHTSADAVKENEIAPTCTTAGSYDSVVYCSVCDAELSRETKSVDALDHNIVNHNAQAPTCTEVGWEAYETCSRCDHSTYVEVPATGHSPKTAVVENNIDPTCTTAGSYDSVVYCATCDVEISRDTEIVSALGHDAVPHDSKAPTCTEIGWNTYVTCSRCDHSTYAELPAIGHSHKSVVTKPTCTTGGYTTYTCHCGDTYVADEVPALGHTKADAVKENDVAPNCTTAGSFDSVVYCSVCNSELSREAKTVDALGHDVENHEAKAPTCTEIGWEAYVTCSRCDHNTYVEIPATGHNHVPAVTAPTCTEKGYTTYTCACGDSYTANEVPATGHTDGAWITDIEPTCTVEGSKHQVCSVCGDSIKTESIDATGHTDGAWITDIEPTCTEPGSKHQVCSTCGATTKTESITTEHTFGKWITIIEVTSTEAGLQQRTCECGEIETRDMSFVYDAYGYKDLANNSNGQARQQLYLSLYNACEKFASNKEYVEAVNGLYLIESIDIADMDIGDAVAVWKVFYVENPIFYWLSNTVTINAEKLSLCIDQDYAAADYREQCDLTIKDMVLDCNSNITIGMSDLEKALAIHDFIVTRMNYAYQSDGITPVDESWAHNMIGCAKYNLGVCESYAKTYQYLCDLNGLECITVTGIGGDEKHAWNLININNTWYGVDATWNDTGMDTLSYIYFGMSEHRLNDGHTAEIFESTGVDYLYRLPIVSSRSLELVDLYNREAFVGTFGNIDEAFAAMDDENGEYIIKLYEYPQNTSPYESDLFVVHSINNTQTLVAKSIMIIGTYFDLGDGLGICTELSINGSLTLQADSLILHDIFLSGEEPLYILDNCLEFSGVYSSVHIPIIGNIEDDANSKIICSTDSHVSFDNEVTVASFVGIENKNPDIDAVFAREAYILKFEGSLWVVSGNVYIRNFYGRNISLTPGSDHIEIKIGNILSEYAYIRVALSKVEAYPSITIGTSNGVIELSFYKHTASSANIFDITCPLSKLGNVAPENVIISLDGRGIITHLYEVNDNGEIVFNREHEHIDGFVLKGTHLLFYTGTQGDIIIPNDVTSIGVKAFSGCTNLESITIPGSVTSIDDEAFSYCNSLTSVTFEEGSQLASIGSQAFLQCTSLTSITIPASVTSIGSYAFYGCSSLTDVYYTGTEEEWNSIIIGTYNESLTNATIHYNYVATEV